MKTIAIAIWLVMIGFIGLADAQSVVTTPGLTPEQCVQANGANSIVTLGCSGRVNTISVSAPVVLTNSQCGSVLVAGSAMSPFEVTLPASPLVNCEFTFVPSTVGFYIGFPSPEYAWLSGYNFQVTQWTIPVVGAFRTNYASVSLQYNGTFWEQSDISSPIFQTAMQPTNAAQLAHGQVYFNWNSSTSQFDLCPSGGPGGLIVDGAMSQVPSNCLALAQSSTTSSARNYFYAVHNDASDPTVSDVSDNGAGKIRLTVSNSLGNTGDTILVSCVNILGAVQANVMDSATVVNSTTLDLQNTSSAGLDPYLSGGNCRVVWLTPSTTGHVLGTNGVQQMSGNPHYTLVGMCWIGPSNSVSDTSTSRGCASWYNRGLKTCINKFTANRTTTSTSYVEVNSEIECNFVTWGTGDPSQSDLSWSISGMMSNNTGNDGAAVTAGFDPEPLPQTEETAGMNPSTPVAGFPFSVRGSVTGLAEGEHDITLLGKAITGGTATVYGTVPDTSLEIRIRNSRPALGRRTFDRLAISVEPSP